MAVPRKLSRGQNGAPDVGKWPARNNGAMSANCHVNEMGPADIIQGPTGLGNDTSAFTTGPHYATSSNQQGLGIPRGVAGLSHATSTGTGPILAGLRDLLLKLQKYSRGSIEASEE